LLVSAFGGAGKSAKSMLCSHCGHEVANPQARFCGNCSAPLAPSPLADRVTPASPTKSDSGSRLWLGAAAAGLLAIVGLFVYFTRPGPCDSIFEQTAPRLETTLHLLKTNGEMIIGRDKIQDLAESSQRIGILCKTCCIAQQSGKINAAQFQDCLNTTKSYETQVLQVASSVDAANAARQKGQDRLASLKVEEATVAANAAAGSVQKLDDTVAAISAATPGATSGGVTREQEPNNSIPQANSIRMGTTIAGEISKPDDVDYFHLHCDSRLRDIVLVRLENTSTTLMPALTLYNSNKSQTQNTYDVTKGASLGFKFVAEPGDDYYLEVSAFSESTGSYNLSVLPQKAYDQYEPNDDAGSATPVRVGQSVTANIMDSKDVDWYRLNGIGGKSLTVSLNNQSTTLQPEITAYDSNRSRIDSHYDVTPGANLKFTLPTDPGKDYYLKVEGFSETIGAYSLSTE
jgi:hypothetical protein